MKKFLIALVAASALSSPASAAVLVLDSGWQNDTLDVAGSPTQNSPWTFTIATTATFSLTDAFLVGDTYTLSGDIVGSTVVGAGANDIRGTGSFGSAWLDPVFGKFTTVVGPGTYTFSITGDGGGGLPAGLGIRLDTGNLNTVPEPATWAMMLAGFGVVGFSMRRRQVRVSFA
jgi:PEP-CTERM motif